MFFSLFIRCYCGCCFWCCRFPSFHTKNSTKLLAKQNKKKTWKKCDVKKASSAVYPILNTRKSRLLCGLTSNNIVVAWRIKRRRKKNTPTTTSTHTYYSLRLFLSCYSVWHLFQRFAHIQHSMIWFATRNAFAYLPETTHAEWRRKKIAEYNEHK